MNLIKPRHPRKPPSTPILPTHPAPVNYENLERYRQLGATSNYQSFHFSRLRLAGEPARRAATASKTAASRLAG
jgi:hypothetical protein